MFTRLVKRHDDKVTPWARFLDEAGAAIDLTDAEVTYTLQNSQTLVNKIDQAPAIVRDQSTWPGEAFYQFETADVDTELYGTEEWQVVYNDGLKESFPVRDEDKVEVYIKPDLDNE